MSNSDHDESHTSPLRTVAFGGITFTTLIDSTGELVESHEFGDDSPSSIGTVVAAYTSQTVYRTHSGQLEVVGYESDFLTAELEDVPAESRSGLVFAQGDVLECIIDAANNKCWFMDYEELSLECIEEAGWVAAASDGRGRWMAVDQEGGAYLFQSTSEFRAATGNVEEADESRQAARFTALKWTTEGEVVEDEGASLPRFSKVSAGNAHFALLSSDKSSPVWIFGDTRFGAIPLNPFPNTSLVGALSRTPESAAPTDMPYLLPVPHFFPSEGFPSVIKDVAAGSRHTLILTSDGDLYGWGWNEEAAFLPFPSPGEQESQLPTWEENIIASPTLISLPSDLTVTKIAASNERSFAVTTCGHLLVSGSNDNGALGLRPDLEGLQRKPRFEREFSAIKREYECVNGFQIHPALNKVVDVHASSISTFVTLKI